eukprot:m.8619 g.8619  ORF g.8619 m.8619 type:complete len:89 (-) comp9226_c0_seq2:42-308(-)
MASSTRSEAIVDQKFDRCLTNSLTMTGTGFGFGVLFSVILFRRRPWPIAMGTGFGAGMAFAECQFDFLNPNILHGRWVKDETEQESTS